jgi:hypothetical protein
MNNTEIAVYLEGGAAALASGEVTWVQCSMGSDMDKTACALGACNYAKYGEIYAESDCWVFQAIHMAAVKRLDESLVGYNDTPGRTMEEVIDALISLAKEFRNA